MQLRIFLFLFGLFQSLVVISQDTGLSRIMGNLNLNDGLTFDNRYEGVRGSPFIFEDYQKASLFSPGTPPIEVEYLNFDRHSRELCYKSSASENAFLLNKYLIDSFHVFLLEDTLRFIRLSPEVNSDFVYMECLFGGENKLFLDHGKNFHPSDYVDPYSADRQYDEFREMPTYYLQFEQGGDLLKIKKNKKQFASLFGEFSGQILAFLKTQKSDLKSKTDLISLMEFYDGIKME